MNDHNNIRELKIDSTLWASPAKIINLLNFKPETLSIKTENNDNIDIKVHQVRFENGGFYLTIDNIKGYFSFINNINVLSMIFSNDDKKNRYHQVEYPPPYQRHVWNYAETNNDAILSALQNVDWHRLFAKKTVHQQVNLLNDTILNIFTNFVPNKVITCDDRDPPWINDIIKDKIKWKNSMYKNYKRNGKKTKGTSYWSRLYLKFLN